MLQKEIAVPGPETICRLGYRDTGNPQTYHCYRNGEHLELSISIFENRNSDKIVYYTRASDRFTGSLRHTAVFRFSKSGDHEIMHKYCLHMLFFDERIAQHFATENTFHPPAHLHTDKAAVLLGWIRICWNNRHFASAYRKLGGLYAMSELITH